MVANGGKTVIYMGLKYPGAIEVKHGLQDTVKVLFRDNASEKCSPILTERAPVIKDSGVLSDCR
jgi:hypothetical protein